MKQSDEQLIRDLVSTWVSAICDGDANGVLGVLASGAVLLTPGKAPMTKNDFAKAAEAKAGKLPKVAVEREILEIEVLGDWAFMRTRMTETVPSTDGSLPASRDGHTLTILRKEAGAWKVARDANLVGRVI
ncbi:YybH family protein [Roseateles sp. P5_E1]